MNKMVIILNINKDLRIRKILDDYHVVSKGNLFSKEERKEIISEYVLRDDYNESLDIKQKLSKKYSTDEKVIDKILKGFHLTLLENHEHLFDELGVGFTLKMNQELDKRFNMLEASPKIGQSLDYLAKESGLKNFNRYLRYSVSEEILESKVVKLK
jgi:hypothetical protein